MARTLLLITGSGRSGTSSLAGSMSHLGLHVPGPHIAANDINPRGFFETAWVVEFHADLLRRAMVRSSDGSPEALARARQVVGPQERGRLEQWLADQPGSLVVKDNQAVWFLDLWSEVSQQAGLDLRLLTSLRHPAEVVGSRDKAWGQGREALDRRMRESSNVAAWLNGALVVEHSGRPFPRAFLRYTDLLADWRSTLTRAFDQLDMSVAVPAPTERHAVDDWIDPGLRTSQLSWADLRVPSALQQQAQDAWDQLGLLVQEPTSTAAERALEEIRTRYDELFLDAHALSWDETRHLQKASARKASAKVRAQLAKAAPPPEPPEPSPGPAVGRALVRRLLRR